MKNMKKIVLFAILFASLVFTTACKKEKNEPKQPIDNTVIPTPSGVDTVSYLIIELSGMKNTNGKVNVALYNTSSSFNKPEEAYREYFLHTTGQSMTIKVDSLPVGEYAFALFHDENDNAILDQNFLNIPKEGFAFSNNAMGNFGPPSYSQAKFSIPKNTKVTQNISLKFL
jgi:uncharacterized protein (DUF2141 family)